MNEPQTVDPMTVTMEVDQQEQRSLQPTYNSGEDSEATQEQGTDEARNSRPFTKRQLTSMERKKSERARKARQVRRLRKWLMPKNAIVALHEMQGPDMAEFTVNTNGQQTKAEIIINNVKYEAIAPNKNLAKAKASEKALRDLILTQMMHLKQQRATDPPAAEPSAGEPSAAGPSAANPDAMDGVEDNAETTEPIIRTEDLPMEHLASFALHKLFTQWEAEGFEMPFMKTTRPKVAPVVMLVENAPGPSFLPKVPKTVADLPPNANMRNPTALFAYMRPQIAYEDLGSNNDQLNREFRAAIRSDNHHFIGTGRSKKLARKAAAIEACKVLFGLEFDESVLNG
ncbi:double-stranded RNA-specific editase 1-like [Anopheles marshallii]|uniref:double-stranded RNA-specific editase 1-like n=1 Tax=Anopheles marshallii TaxID=1521116 RepID=UPI00237B6856|nr:double-stranded RNA-specific editase 1-like [Anopheles marshallii]